MSIGSVRGRLVLALVLCVGCRAENGPSHSGPGSVPVLRTPLDALSASTLVSLGDGSRLRAFDIDPNLPRTLVFVHGDAVSADFWLPQVLHFLGRFRMVLYDRAECGGSSVGREPVTYSTSASELGGLLSKLGVQDYILVGHSRGQEIAATYFASRPRGLRAFIASGTALQPTPSEECRAQARNLLRSEEARAALVQGACEEFTNDLGWIRAAMRLSETDARGLVSFWCASWRPQEGILGCTDVDIAQTLSEIDIPMLQIDGGAYREGVDRQQTMQRWYRNSRLLLVEGAKHVPSLSHVEKFNQAMDEIIHSVGW